MWPSCLPRLTRVPEVFSTIFRRPCNRTSTTTKTFDESFNVIRLLSWLFNTLLESLRSLLTLWSISVGQLIP